MKDNQAKYPQLRFKGFTDPWEKRTLGQTTTKAKSYSLSRDVERDHETGYRYIHYGDIHTGVADIVTEHTKLPNIEPANYDELRVNDLVVADASEDYQGIAEPAVVVGLPTHLVAGLHTITLRPSSASSLYLYYLLHTDSFKHFGYQMGTGLKVFGISWSNLSKFTFMIPSRPEQEMIVKLIESVDNLIAVNQRKLTKLKELKQGYLQKMFPKNGSKFPQLRFAGFADAWEQRKLGKMGYTFTGLSGKTKEDFGHGNAKFVTYMNVFSSPVSNSEMVENVEVDSKQHQVEYGDVFFTTSSETPQEVGMSSVWLETAENIYLNSFCFGYHPMVEFDPYYLAFMLRSPVIRKKFMLLAQGISRYNISKNKVMEMLVPVPEIVEQQKIGSFFKQLDDTITLHQRKLEKLQELKKGYLQKMFC